MLSRRGFFAAALASVSAGVARAVPSTPGWAVRSRQVGKSAAAADAINDYMRRKMREEGFYRRIMLP